MNVVAFSNGMSGGFKMSLMHGSTLQSGKTPLPFG
jgi:hypothetical protein